MNNKIIDLIAERGMIEQFKKIAYSKSMLVIADESNFADQETAQTWYYYSGPLDEKTRPFCTELLRIDAFYRESDLNMLSKKVGYNVYDNSGGFNCRHTWNKVKAKLKQETPSRGQINRASVKQDSRVQDYFPFILPFPKED